MPVDEPKPFACRCGAVLGLITRGAEHRARLQVFRDTLPGGALLSGSLAEYRFRVRNLEQGTVDCDLCGAGVAWVASERVLADLLARRKTRTFGLEVEDD